MSTPTSGTSRGVSGGSPQGYPSSNSGSANTANKVHQIVDNALSIGGHRTTGQWMAQKNHRSVGEWAGQGNHRSVWEWFSGTPSRNKK